MGRPDSKRVTMLDVAKQSGVSYQTVSRVINNHPAVAAETRQRVLAVIEALNYRPSKAARSLAAHQSQTLAVITYTMKYYGPTQMVVHIEESARAAGYDLIYSNIDPASGDSTHDAIDRILRWAVDGVLIIAPVKSKLYDHLIQQFSQMPLIQIDIEPGASTPSVIVDQYAGSQMITRHLLGQGHRRLCEISGPLNWFGAVARQAGFRDTLREAGLTPVASIAGDWSADSGYAAAKKLLAGPPFTVIAAANDQMALGALSALAEAGLRVPEDVSVVGFDDIPESRYLSPPLTTVRQDFPELGRQGFQYLLERIQDPQRANGQRVIQPHLVIRQSTCPPRTP